MRLCYHVSCDPPDRLPPFLQQKQPPTNSFTHKSHALLACDVAFPVCARPTLDDSHSPFSCSLIISTHPATFQTTLLTIGSSRVIDALPNGSYSSATAAGWGTHSLSSNTAICSTFNHTHNRRKDGLFCPQNLRPHLH